MNGWKSSNTGPTPRGPSCAFIFASVVGAGVLVSTSLAAARQHDRSAVVHFLNRATFGPTSEDVEAVMRLGMPAWLERQLSPRSIDDSTAEARLPRFTVLALSPRELAARVSSSLARPAGSAGREQVNTPLDLRSLGPGVIEALSEQKVVRAAFSERQLQEVFTDFWWNHFNVAANKGATRLFVASYERDAIRPYVLGRFRDLLGATAHSPAMLFYLDNWMSAAPASATLLGGPRNAGRRPPGINENYARELLELHTLGVQGGYMQDDVVNVARAFTGWSIDEPRRGGGFVFRSAWHDAQPKTVLGIRLTRRGEAEGEEVLDILSRHPSTARFIATKLARRFVSDSPPSTLVDRLASTFQHTDGDLRAVMRSLFLSPEFTSADVRLAKVKTPLEFVVSAVRATSARVDRARPLALAIRELGMPLYLAEAPTGYRDDAAAWTTTASLIGRMNFAVALAEGRLPGVRLPRSNSVIDDAPGVLPRVAAQQRDASEATTPTDRIALALGAPEFQRH